jgi:O-acetyl-ADP-ribose deacetylase (regulator of RNase III)
MDTTFGDTRLTLVAGNIVTQKVDAVVNAANSSLMGGGGVDGAIHNAGGPEIKEECREIVKARGTLPTGQAVATRAGRLPATWVIHTVGPVWSGGDAGEAQALANAYRSSLGVARRAGARTVAFPSLSTGAYGYPMDQAALVALGAVREELEAHPGSFDEIRIVLWGAKALLAYETALSALLGEGVETDL